MPTDLRRTAIVGRPVAHSLSPVLHNAGYAALGLPYSYTRLEAAESELPGLLAALDESWAGLSVTMPGKRAALELASVATDRAQAVGAANTLVRRDGGWAADCTDVDGVVGALRVVGGLLLGGDVAAGDAGRLEAGDVVVGVEVAVGGVAGIAGLG